jgi:hypothetical protein
MPYPLRFPVVAVIHHPTALRSRAFSLEVKNKSMGLFSFANHPFWPDNNSRFHLDLG